jgi:hypothetical protein
MKNYKDYKEAVESAVAFLGTAHLSSLDEKLIKAAYKRGDDVITAAKKVEGAPAPKKWQKKK